LREYWKPGLAESKDIVILIYAGVDIGIKSMYMKQKKRKLRRHAFLIS